jgi:uncharacterized membrane protein
MRSHVFLLVLSVASLVKAQACNAGAAQVTFVDLGLLQTDPKLTISNAVACSDNGTAVIGTVGTEKDGQVSWRAFRWDEVTGTALIEIPGYSVNPACISSDGLVVAGTCNPNGSTTELPFVWRTDGSWKILPTATSSGSRYLVRGMSANGNVIVGVRTSPGNFEAALWIAGELVTPFPVPAGWAAMHATAIDASGRFWAGMAVPPGGTDQIPVVGDIVEGTIQSVNPGALSSAPMGWATGVGANRTVSGFGPVGGGQFPGRGLRMQPSASVTTIEPLAGTQSCEVWSMSQDGQFLSGTSIDHYGEWRAFVWSAEWHSLDLRFCLQHLGSSMTGWQMSEAFLSRDGSCVVGTGTRFGRPRGFLVRGLSGLEDCVCSQHPDLPICCPEDLYRDHVVNGADLGILLASWNQWGSAADLTRDGVVDGADLGMLLNAWGACPN